MNNILSDITQNFIQSFDFTNVMSDAESPQANSTEPPETTRSSPPSTSREELMSRARSFLHSPQIQHEDANSKHRFLAEKGLTDLEIDVLLRELVGL